MCSIMCDGICWPRATFSMQGTSRNTAGTPTEREREEARKRERERARERKKEKEIEIEFNESGRCWLRLSL